VIQKLLEFVCGGIRKSLEMQTREALEWYKQILMGGSGGNLEDQNADINTDSKDCAHEISDANWTLGN
jgi:hypothetical protein